MDIRPIVAGETLRAIVSRYVLQQSAEDSPDYLPETQWVFTSVFNGMQSAIYTVRKWSRRLGSKNLCKIDCVHGQNGIKTVILVEFLSLPKSMPRWFLSLLEVTLGSLVPLWTHLAPL